MLQFPTTSLVSLSRTTVSEFGPIRTLLLREFVALLHCTSILTCTASRTVNPLNYASLKTLTEVHGKFDIDPVSYPSRSDDLLTQTSAKCGQTYFTTSTPLLLLLTDSLPPLILILRKVDLS